MQIFAIIPAYNENVNELSEIIKKLSDFVSKVVVVDDGSKNNTLKKIKKIKNCFLVRHEINRGQGAALQTGTDFAMRNGADIIVHFDADGQHRPEDISSLINPIREKNVDFVFGSRFIDKKTEMPITKKFIIIPLAKIINIIFTSLNLSDAHNGLRAFGKNVANDVYLSQDRMAHSTEYPYLVKKHKIKYTEVPVRIIYNEYGQGFLSGVKIIKELLVGKIID